jgi:hypothetical protein
MDIQAGFECGPAPSSGELAVSDEAKSLRGRVRRSDLVVTVFACSLLFRP